MRGNPDEALLALLRAGKVREAAEYAVHVMGDALLPLQRRVLGGNAPDLMDPLWSIRDALVAYLREQENEREREIAAVAAVLRLPAMFDVDYAGGLICIRPTDQGTIEVEWEIEGEENAGHRAFVASDVEGAARFFVEKRHELRYGNEYGTGPDAAEPPR